MKDRDGLITSNNCFRKQMEEAAGSVVSWMMWSVDSDVLNQLISEAEVRAAVSKLKRGKACRLDNILAEMLKLGGIKISMFLVTYFNNLFDKGIYPREWAKAFIVSIHKKGIADLPDNYRGRVSVKHN